MIELKSKSFKTELYRKAIHLSSLWMPLLIISMPRNFCIILFCGLLAANFLVEYAAYQKMPGSARCFAGCLSKRSATGK